MPWECEHGYPEGDGCPVVDCPSTASPAQADAILAVLRERDRQEAKCAEKRREGLVWLTCADPRMPDGDKLAVLVEEIGEVAKELCDARAAKCAASSNLRVELVQVAAVALAWIEALACSDLIGPERSEGPCLARRAQHEDEREER